MKNTSQHLNITVYMNMSTLNKMDDSMCVSCYCKPLIVSILLLMYFHPRARSALGSKNFFVVVVQNLALLIYPDFHHGLYNIRVLRNSKNYCIPLSSSHTGCSEILVIFVNARISKPYNLRQSLIA